MAKLVRVRKGQVWKSLDPRENGRLITVTQLTDTHAVALSNISSRPTVIRLDRFVPGARGFSYVRTLRKV